MLIKTFKDAAFSNAVLLVSPLDAARKLSTPFISGICPLLLEGLEDRTNRDLRRIISSVVRNALGQALSIAGLSDIKWTITKDSVGLGVWPLEGELGFGYYIAALSLQSLVDVERRINDTMGWEGLKESVEQYARDAGDPISRYTKAVDVLSYACFVGKKQQQEPSTDVRVVGDFSLETVNEMKAISEIVVEWFKVMFEKAPPDSYHLGNIKRLGITAEVIATAAGCKLCDVIIWPN